jgi:hypothetical protein
MLYCFQLHSRTVDSQIIVTSPAKGIKIVTRAGRSFGVPLAALFHSQNQGQNLPCTRAR